MAKSPGFKKQEQDRGKSLADYWPLLALILISIAVAGALSWPLYSSRWVERMHYFMGFFLCSFAMLKLFHPSAFVEGFSMYDLIAKRIRVNGYIYPFIELGLGLMYLSFWYPLVTYAATVVVMSISAIGVIYALRRGLDINCPCMGSVLDVPLSTVTLTEDIGMGVMAAVMLVTQVNSLGFQF